MSPTRPTCRSSSTRSAPPSPRTSTAPWPRSPGSASGASSRSISSRYADGLAGGLARHGLTAPTAHVGPARDADPTTIFDAAAELGIGTRDPAVDRSGALAVRRRRRADRRRAERASATARPTRGTAGRLPQPPLRARVARSTAVTRSRSSPTSSRPGVVLEVDTYWAFAGGADVPALLRRLGDRVAALHVKDGDGDARPEAARSRPAPGSCRSAEILAAAPRRAPRRRARRHGGRPVRGRLRDSRALPARPRPVPDVSRTRAGRGRDHRRGDDQRRSTSRT